MPPTWKTAIALITAILAVGAEAAIAAPDPTLASRAEEAGRLIGPNPPTPDAVFDPSFLKAVPADQLLKLGKQLRSQVGDFTAMRRLAGGDDTHGTFELSFTKGHTIKADVAIAPVAPHKIVGLLYGPAKQKVASLDDLVKQFAALPGRATFAVHRLPDGKPPELRAGYEPARALAIGSAFKLWILGALAEDVAAGKRKWTDIVPLDAAAISLPSGRLRDWPVGSPFTLHTLAGAMISESDNTATDQLLRLLGRERVEAMVAKMGVKDAARNRPLLSTLEMFKIKAGSDRSAPQTWAGMDEGRKRAYLDGVVAKMPRDAVQNWDEPRALDTLEWFASADDLARMLVWLRDRSERGEAGQVRGLLAINAGIRFDTSAWPYAGFKGGSEPGVLAAAYLLRGADGKWWTLTGAWNDPAKPVDTSIFFGLLEQAADLIAAERGPLEPSRSR